MGIIIPVIFVIGYTAIVFEHPLKVNKAAIALMTAALSWGVFAAFSHDKEEVVHFLAEHLSDISGILFFLLGAMTIVEIIDAHDGFEIVTNRIRTRNKRKLVWILGFITFFLSAVLDNLTTTIVIISLLRKIVTDRKERLLLAGMVIIAANAGGAWSPIGDVTTTMLWIRGQITSATIVHDTFLPSLVCFLLPTYLIGRQMKGEFEKLGDAPKNRNYTTSSIERNSVFWLGVGSLVFVPVFKTLTHLPPFMGIIFGLGLMWIVTEVLHTGKNNEEKGLLSVNHALRKIDTPSVLFFLGILLSISALEATGILVELAQYLNRTIGNINVITLTIGLLSAVIDNVPLVAAAQGMYSMTEFPTDHYFWKFLAYCAGTGGSALIIGSAAGVAAMGLEKIEFFWYVKKISWLAIIGYAAGAAIFMLQTYLLHW